MTHAQQIESLYRTCCDPITPEHARLLILPLYEQVCRKPLRSAPTNPATGGKS